MNISNPIQRKTACFTGHRPDKLGGFKSNNPIADNVKAKLRAAIEVAIEEGYTDFISGGALGVDQWAAQIVLNIKESNPNIRLIIAKPFPSQDSVWPESSKNYFKKLCDSADEVVNVSPDPYSAQKMQVRNEYMINRSDLVIAVWDGTSGGTANAVNYAKYKNKKVVQIKPKKEF